MQTPAQRRASLKNLQKARAARRGGKHRSPAQRAAAVANLKKARAAVTTAGRRRGQLHRKPHMVKAHTVRAHTVRAHHSREAAHRRSDAAENPLGMGETVAGLVTGVLGFGAADVLDRFLATHALTDGGQKDSNGFEVYTDNPPTSGNYTGLYNATAILAPMDAVRWIAGGVIAGVPILAGHAMRSSPVTMFGFGAAMRVVGKGLVDLSSYLLRKTSSGQRLYDAELRAMAAKAGSPGGNTSTYPTLPTAGLGAAPMAHGFGCPCGGCRRAMTPSPLPPPAPMVPPPAPAPTTVQPAPAPAPAPAPRPAAVPTSSAVAAASSPAAKGLGWVGPARPSLLRN